MGNKILRSYILGKTTRETLAAIEARFGLPRTVSIEAGIRRLAEIREGRRRLPDPPEPIIEPLVKSLGYSLRLSDRAIEIVEELANRTGETRTAIVERAVVAIARLLKMPEPPAE